MERRDAEAQRGKRGESIERAWLSTGAVNHGEDYDGLARFCDLVVDNERPNGHRTDDKAGDSMGLIDFVAVWQAVQRVNCVEKFLSNGRRILWRSLFNVRCNSNDIGRGPRLDDDAIGWRH